MKLPSLNHVVTGTGTTIFRYPFETLCALTATTVGHVALQESGHEELLQKIAMCASLGLVVFLSSSLFFDTSQRWASKRYWVQLLLLGLLIGYYFTFSSTPKDREVLQFVVLNISFHLAVSFAAFLHKGFDVLHFWEFNKLLFIRFLTAALYSGVLFAGLSLAITAVDNLFDLHINGKIYGHLFFTIAGIFNTLFFLAGIPRVQQESLNIEYPKGLKAFTQFVLIPLVSIYLIILLAYEGKILFTLSLPFGWVSILILVYAIFGILSFLLVYPVSHLEANVWMRTFHKLFYYFMVPLLVLLFWAILYRISHYGFTPERYYVFILALWLTFITSYFLSSSSANIKIIPLSLCITGLITVYGPQSATYVSKMSQLHRYQNYLQQNDEQQLSAEEQVELSSVVDYLLTNHGSDFLIEQSSHKLDTLTASESYSYNKKVMAALGLEYRTSNRYGSSSTEYFNVWSRSSNIHTVTNYDFIIELSSNGKITCDSCLQLNNTYYAVSTVQDDGVITIELNGEKITIDVNAFANQLKPESGGKYNHNDLTQKVQTEHYAVQVFYNHLSGYIKKSRYEIESCSGIICIGVKP